MVQVDLDWEAILDLLVHRAMQVQRVNQRLEHTVSAVQKYVFCAFYFGPKSLDGSYINSLLLLLLLLLLLCSQMMNYRVVKRRYYLILDSKYQKYLVKIVRFLYSSREFLLLCSSSMQFYCTIGL